MQQPPEQKPKPSIESYAKYGGMAFQFLAACLLGAFVGKWLDAKMQLDRPIWAVFLTIGFMVASFYSIYRQLLKN